MKLRDTLNSDEQREFYQERLESEATLVDSNNGRTYRIDGGGYFFASNCGSDAHSETGEDGTWITF